MKDGAARVAAGLVGAPLAASLVGCAVSVLPGPAELNFALGFHLAVPLWAGLACALPSASGGRAWALVAAMSLPSALYLLARQLS